MELRQHCFLNKEAMLPQFHEWDSLVIVFYEQT
jgi:hypothetical protein